jgi:hypothetical protein
MAADPTPRGLFDNPPGAPAPDAPPQPYPAEPGYFEMAFTGSRQGCTPAQLESLGMFLRVLFGKGLRLLRHGACRGADEQAALLGRDMKLYVIAHPGHLEEWTSAPALAASDLVLDREDTLARNRAMMDLMGQAGVAVGCPSGPEAEPSQRRSGTWAALRHARRLGRRVATVWPDGALRLEGWR